MGQSQACQQGDGGRDGEEMGKGYAIFFYLV